MSDCAARQTDKTTEHLPFPRTIEHNGHRSQDIQFPSLPEMALRRFPHAKANLISRHDLIWK